MTARGGRGGWTAGVGLVALFVSACGGSQHGGSRQESGLHPGSGARPVASGAPRPAAPEEPKEPLQAFPQGSAPGLPSGAVLRFGDDRLRLEGAPSKVAVAGGRAVTVRRLEAELWDLSSGDRLAALQLSKRPLSLALANDHLFVTEYNRPTHYLRRLSLRKGAPDVRVDLHGKSFEFPLAVSPDGTRAWVASGRTLIAFDTSGAMQERWRRQLGWSAPGISEGGITELIHSEHGVIVVAGRQVALLDDGGHELSRFPATYAAPTPQGLVFGRKPGSLRLLPWGKKGASELPIDFAGPLKSGGRRGALDVGRPQERARADRAGRAWGERALSYPRLFHECAVVGPKLLAYAFDPAADKTEVFWLDPQGNKPLFQLEGSANLACAPDGAHLVRFGREDSDPDLLLDAKGKLVRELGVSKARYPLVSFTTDGKHFGVGVDQLKVEVWSQSASGFEKRATLELAPDPDSPRTAGSFRVAPGGTHVYQRRAHDVLVFPVHDPSFREQ